MEKKKKLPVCFRSKFDQNLESFRNALAFAVEIEMKYDIIRECKHPLIVCSNSKLVHKAVKMINEGKSSSSARMSSFLTNVNKNKIESNHISGNAKFNLKLRNPGLCSSEFCSINENIDEQQYLGRLQ